MPNCHKGPASCRGSSQIQQDESLNRTITFMDKGKEILVLFKITF